MKRKTYIIISLVITFILCVLVHIYDNTKYENLVGGIFLGGMAIIFLYTSYLLIVKKSYNLLAGMTEEKAARIKNNPEEEKKVIELAKTAGYIFIFVGLLMLLLAYLSLINRV